MQKVVKVSTIQKITKQI